METFTANGGSSLDSLASHVKLARCSKTYDENPYRILCNAYPATQQVADVLILLMKEYGAEQKLNAVPKGPRERRLEDCLRGQKQDDEE